MLLTGASGYVASQLRNAFRDRFDLRMTDVQVVYGISGNTRAFWSLESPRAAAISAAAGAGSGCTPIASSNCSIAPASAR